MTAAPEGSVSDAVLMTLAGIAYGSPPLIARYLNEAAPTKGQWSVAWLAAPPDPPINFAFVAQNTISGDYVVAIRGTYPNPFSPAYWEDGDEDSPFGDMVAWPGPSTARISAGTSKGLAEVSSLTDKNGATLAAVIGTLASGASVTVTGHSLGGTLAPVVALKLTEAFPHLQVEAASFAGMTPGDSGFAALFGAGSALDGKVWRVFNTLDTVAYGWDKVLATHDFYQPAPQGGVVVSAMLLATAARLDLGGYDYTAIGLTVPLQGAVRPVKINCDLVAYVLENLHQHMPDTYLGLLGAPPLPFSILLGTIVAPRGLPAAVAASEARLPVVYADG